MLGLIHGLQGNLRGHQVQAGWRVHAGTAARMQTEPTGALWVAVTHYATHALPSPLMALVCFWCWGGV
jgi:hypothetical protein